MEAIGEASQEVSMEAFRVATQEYGLVGEVEAIGEVPRAATRQHGQTGGAEIIWEVPRGAIRESGRLRTIDTDIKRHFLRNT